MNEDFLKRIEANGGVGKLDKFKLRAKWTEYAKENGEGVEALDASLVGLNIASNSLAMQRKKFKGLYHKAMTFASTDESRKQLNGVCVTHTRDGMEVAATDGRRLFMQKVKAEDMGDELVLGEFRICEPVKDTEGRVYTIEHGMRRRSEIDWDLQEREKAPQIQTILFPLKIGEKICKALGIASQGDLDALRERMANDENEFARVFNLFGQNADVSKLTCDCLYAEGTIWREMEGIYPNYHQVIPDLEKCMSFAHFERLAPYLNARKKLNSLIEQKNIVGFKRTEADDEYKCFSGNYLLDAIHALSGDVTCYLGDKYSPIELVDENGGLSMIMPMRDDCDGGKGTCFCLLDLERLPEWGGGAKATSPAKAAMAKEEAKQETKTEVKEMKQEQQQDAMGKVFELTESAREGLCKVRKYLNYYGQKYEDIRQIDFINMLYKEGKCSAKTYPKKDGSGVWKIACDTLFDEDCFNYALHLLMGGKMIEIPENA